MITLRQQLRIVSDLIHITDNDGNEIYDGIKTGREYAKIVKEFGNEHVVDVDGVCGYGKLPKITIEVELVKEKRKNDFERKNR